MMIPLDTNLLGAITNPKPKSPTVHSIIAWAAQMRRAGHTFVIPSIAVYEIRRELLRTGAVASIAKLDAFVHSPTNVFLPMTDAVLTRAAQLWADTRNVGKPTATDAALDGDVILMAQVLEAAFPATDYVIATDNLKHFQPWVKADHWQNIVP